MTCQHKGRRRRRSGAVGPFPHSSKRGLGNRKTPFSEAEEPARSRVVKSKSDVAKIGTMSTTAERAERGKGLPEVPPETGVAAEADERGIPVESAGVQADLLSGGESCGPRRIRLR
ncbi:unnamed protein product [Amoebophrya sp. A120]|nr:unnamed protein product [Amoebophrya sp. A120]|eukprot:GSA120T00013224001.1